MLRQNIRIFLLFILVLFFLILLRNGGIFDTGTIFRSWFVPKRAVNSLLQQPDDLEEAYKVLLAENNQLKALAEENEQLRSLLEFRDSTDQRLVAANVISRDIVNQNILIIDAGSNQGIIEGQAAVVNNGIVIGKVFDVSSDASRLRLLTDSFSKLGVSIGSATGVSGLLTGSLGLGMTVDFVPQGDEVLQGDTVVTADIDINIPPGLVVGRVEEITFKEEDIFKSASVTPLIDYQTIGFVGIITK